MSVAVDIPRKRIYIKGDLFNGYYWLMRWFMPEYVTMYTERPFWLTKNRMGEVILKPQNGWTIEHTE